MVAARIGITRELDMSEKPESNAGWLMLDCRTRGGQIILSGFPNQPLERENNTRTVDFPKFLKRGGSVDFPGNAEIRQPEADARAGKFHAIAVELLHCQAGMPAQGSRRWNEGAPFRFADRMRLPG